jgi:hypothetical protein
VCCFDLVWHVPFPAHCALRALLKAESPSPGDWLKWAMEDGKKDEDKRTRYQRSSEAVKQ